MSLTDYTTMDDGAFLKKVDYDLINDLRENLIAVYERINVEHDSADGDHDAPGILACACRTFGVGELPTYGLSKLGVFIREDDVQIMYQEVLTTTQVIFTNVSYSVNDFAANPITPEMLAGQTTSGFFLTFYDTGTGDIAMIHNGDCLNVAVL